MCHLHRACLTLKQWYEGSYAASQNPSQLVSHGVSSGMGLLASCPFGRYRHDTLMFVQRERERERVCMVVLCVFVCACMRARARVCVCVRARAPACVFVSVSNYTTGRHLKCIVRQVLPAVFARQSKLRFSCCFPLLFFKHTVVPGQETASLRTFCAVQGAWVLISV